MKKILALAVLTAALSVSVSTALAGPLMLGPTVLPSSPKVTAVPVVKLQTSSVQAKLLNSYRQLRSFWVSRAIVR